MAKQHPLPNIYGSFAATTEGRTVLIEILARHVARVMGEFTKRGYEVFGHSQNVSRVYEVHYLSRMVLVEVGSRPQDGGYQMFVSVDGEDAQVVDLMKRIESRLTRPHQPRGEEDPVDELIREFKAVSR